MAMTFPEVRRHKEYAAIRDFIKGFIGKDGKGGHYNVAVKNALAFLERLMVDFSYISWFPWPEVSVDGINTVEFLWCGENCSFSMEVLANQKVELFYRGDNSLIYDEMHIDDIFSADSKKFIKLAAKSLYYSRTGIEVII